MPHNTSVDSTTIDGTQADVAPLETISLELLAAKDPQEIRRLQDAARAPGFFYLDLQSKVFGGLATTLESIYALERDYFEELSAKKLEATASEASNALHEPQGGAVEIKQDDIARGLAQWPAVLSEHGKTLDEFANECHSANLLILSCLSAALDLPDSKRFERHHRHDRPSDSSFSLIYAPTRRYRADAPDTTHTDGGTLTLLFCEQWGIMLEHPETNVWAYVAPKKGCAIVNVADHLQELSENHLHSCRHAVTQPLDGIQNRYYVVSYLRPEVST